MYSILPAQGLWHQPGRTAVPACKPSSLSVQPAEEGVGFLFGDPPGELHFVSSATKGWHMRKGFPFPCTISLSPSTVDVTELERVLEIKCYSLSCLNNNIVDSCHLLSSSVPGTVLMMEKR